MSHDPAIYRYSGGADAPERFADPLAVQRKLRTLLGGDGSAVLAAWQGPDPMAALDAAERLLAAIAYAFEVKPFDPATGKGLTEDKLIALWNDFHTWLKKKQTTTANSATSSPPTAGSGPVATPIPSRSSALRSTLPASTPGAPGPW